MDCQTLFIYNFIGFRFISIVNKVFFSFYLYKNNNNNEKKGFCIVF